MTVASQEMPVRLARRSTLQSKANSVLPNHALRPCYVINRYVVLLYLVHALAYIPYQPTAGSEM